MSHKKQTNKYKEKLTLLQSIGEIIVLKSKKARVVTYTCRYCSGYLIPIVQLYQDKLWLDFTKSDFDAQSYVH